jgi:5-(carboxyamino)imidazole ribonucleotide synthase
MPAAASDLSTATIPAPATLGLLGGGQLGLFFVQAAQKMGYRVQVLDPDPTSPAGRIADRHLVAAYDDRAALDALATDCAAITTEFENVPAPTLAYLAGSVRVRPSAAAVAVCQDRIAEKTFLRDHRLPHGPFAVIRTEKDLNAAPRALFPGVLKVARFGYDGKGQFRVASREEARVALQTLGGKACVLEALLPLDCEVSVVMARDASGATSCFPVVENSHRHGILDVSIVPARISPALAESARACALRIAAALEFIGTLGVEFFISRSALYVNEMAPRPHNSGHYTLDATDISQYEQQVRALCGLPLGDPVLLRPAVMVNLLGDLWTDGEPKWSLLTESPDFRLHLYRKHEARPGRKMGHFTVLGSNLPDVLTAALEARSAIGIRD